MSVGGYVVVPAEAAPPEQVLGRVSFFNEDGTPWSPGDGGPVSVAWGNVTGKPTSFPPASHSHAYADITGTPTIPAAPTWANISGKPAVVASGADQAEARSAIGAGTSTQTLSALTAAEAETGTATTLRGISAAVLAAEIDRRIAAALADTGG